MTASVRSARADSALIDLAPIDLSLIDLAPIDLSGAPRRLSAVKALLPVGIVLVVLGIAAGFGYQIATAVTTGLPTNGIGWLQTSGFVLAAIGAIMIGVSIGRRRAVRRAEREQSQQR